MPDLHYEHPRLAGLYDLDSSWGPDRDFYLRLPRPAPQSILDLGCGTGLLCDAYAALGHDVTGVDPAPAMLDVARRKPHGARIEWVQATARTFRSDRLYDLIIMTGHAFQVLLTADEVRAAFANMRDHLKPSGRIVFESRNPDRDWPALWNAKSFDYPVEGGVRQTFRCGSMVNGKLRFEAHYAFPDEHLVSQSELLFLSRSEIEAHLDASGLRAEVVMGDWDGTLFDELSSCEMIVVATHAR